MAEIIKFPETTTFVSGCCSFCHTPLVKVKYIQADENSPAICFSCVERCNELLKGQNETKV